MSEQYQRHKQPWTPDENQKLQRLAAKGQGLKAIAKALKRTEESTKAQAGILKIGIAKLR